MQLNYKQSQFELFPGAVSGSTKTHRPQFLFSSITFSLENLVISGILILMSAIFSFSAGVEKGKRINLVKSDDASLAPTISTSPNTPSMSKPTAQTKPMVTQVSSVSKPIVNTPNIIVAKPIASEVKVDKTQVALQKQAEVISDGYTIQVASFKKDEYAQKEALMLKKKGYDIMVVPKGIYSIVCVGKFSRKEQAHIILSQLKKTYKDCVIRRL